MSNLNDNTESDAQAAHSLGFETTIKQTNSKTTEQLQHELFEKFDPTAVIDAYERQKGRGAPAKPKKNVKVEHFVRVWDISKPIGLKQFEELLNNKDYRIIQQKDSITPTGQVIVYTIFSKTTPI